MTGSLRQSHFVIALALALVAGAGAASPVRAQSGFPDIPVWSYPGAFQAGPDSIREQPRTITVRWLRDPAAERRLDFGGYRIYRVFNAPDTTRMVLIRRFSVNANDSLFMWHFPNITDTTPLAQRVATFIDPDSNGNFVKAVPSRPPRAVPDPRRLDLRADRAAGAARRLPHLVRDHLRAAELPNNSSNDYRGPVRAGPRSTARFRTATRRAPNLNNKAANLTRRRSSRPPARPPTSRRCRSVPNPYRATEAWDQPGANEVHFINLPPQATIRIYTAAGDLVRRDRAQRHGPRLRALGPQERHGRGRRLGHLHVPGRSRRSSRFQNRFVVIR